MAAGITMLAMAALAVSSGELRLENIDVRAVVLVDAQIKVVFGAGLIALARIAIRQSSGAALGTGMLGALGACDMSAALTTRIPGVSLQITLPGNNVLNSSNLDVALQSVRASWHEPVEIGLAASYLLAFLAAMCGLLPAFVRQLPALDGRHLDQPLPPPDTELVAATSRCPGPQETAEPAAVDPWISSRSLASPTRLDDLSTLPGEDNRPV